MAMSVDFHRCKPSGKTRRRNLFSEVFRLTVDFLVMGRSREEFALSAPKVKGVDPEITKQKMLVRVNSHCAGGGIRIENLDEYARMIDTYVKECDCLDRLWQEVERYKSAAVKLFDKHKYAAPDYVVYPPDIEGGALSAALAEITKETLYQAFRGFRTVREQSPRTDVKKLRRRVVAFDLDGTLIKNIRFSWQILRDKLGIVSKDNLKRKAEFESGAFSYEDWCKFDYEELSGHGLTRRLAREAVEDAKKKNARLTENLREGIARLKAQGCTVALISGGADCVLYGFIPDADELFDAVYINKFIFDDGDDGLLLDIVPTKYDGSSDCFGVDGKEGALKMLCEKTGTRMSEAVFVGDDTNDLGVMESAGLGIFYYTPDLQGETRDAGARGWPRNMRMIGKNDLNAVVDMIFDWYKQNGWKVNENN